MADSFDDFNNALNMDDPFGEIDDQQQEPVNVTNTTDWISPATDNMNNNSGNDDSVLNDYLAANGISDPSKIKFDDGKGNVADRDWKSLTKEEKLGILDSTRADDSTQLSDEEIDLINAIRQSQMQPSAYINSLQASAAQYVASAQQPVYEIDGISDDELFVLDALDRYGEENVTDDQLQKLLDDAKSDEELYNKTVQNLRAQYKNREDELKVQQQQQYEMQQEQDFALFQDNILNEIQSLNNVGGLAIDMTSEDMNNLATFILSRDEYGNSDFGKAMNNPKLFTEAAFWILHGNDIMGEISSQLKKEYDKGYAAGKAGQSQLAFNDKVKDTKTGPAVVGNDSAFGLDFS